MTVHAVVIAGGGPTGLMLAGELAFGGGTPLDISDFPTRHNYGLGSWQNHIERILAGWVRELGVRISYGSEVTGLAVRVFTLLHEARPVLLNLGEPGGFDIAPRTDRVLMVDATYDGVWELPVLGAVTAPAAVLIRPDGHVAWVGDRTQPGLGDALTTWFGPPTAA